MDDWFKSVFIKDPELQVAHRANHEAGHAVVTMALDVHLVEVFLSRGAGKSIRGDMSALSVEERCSKGGIIAMAGYAAQLIWDPRVGGWGFDDDNHNLKTEWDELNKSEPQELKTFEAQCLAKANKLVARHWVSIQVLAAELKARRHLTGDEAANAIGWQNPQA